MNRPETRYTPSLLYGLFFLSGLTSLVYEIVWGRILATILGNTSLAIAIVVSIFMTGLAAGSFLAVRSRLRSIRPLIAYGMLEGGIGIYAMLTSQLAKVLDWVYASAYSNVADQFFLSVLLKGCLSAGLLLLPTVAMGASLPILIRLYPEEERHKHASLLYGVNTGGAVAGTLLSGYILLPEFGITQTIWFSAGTNLLIAFVALLVRGSMADQPEPSESRFRAIYLLFLLSGFTTLAYEILWARALSMYFGSSVYAFASILACFLIGIAAGSTYYSTRIARDADAFQFYSLMQFRLALATMFFVGIFMGLPVLLIKLYQTLYFSFPLFQAGQFLLIGAAIFYATFVSGATFPAALHFFRKESARLPSHTAYLYTYSTIGGILGSLLAGFLLIPALGVERGIRVVVLVNLILGILCFRRSKPERQDRRVLAIGGVALALLLFLPAWNRSILNAGFYAFAYKYVPPNRPHSQFKDAPAPPPKFLQAGLVPHYRFGQDLNLLYYGEGLTATVAVAEDERGIRSLLINGKPDASNVPTGDMRTQLLQGHLPVLLKGSVQDALVIGLGSGVTAGALQQHHPRRIDCVEIEKKVTQAAVFFETENLGILREKNFHLILDDGRNVVLHSKRNYDIITSEPSNLWMSGVANLFTLEFFQAAKKRLRPDGVMCQWIHLYQISPDDILIFLKTFQSVFPHITIWIDDSDMLIVGSDRKLPIDPAVLAARMSQADVEQSLLRSDLTPQNLLKKYVSDERILKLLRPDVPVNTDDHPILEFSAPQSLFWNRSAEIASALRELKRIADEAGL